MQESEVKARAALDTLLEKELSAVINELATLADPIHLLGLVVEITYNTGKFSAGDNFKNAISVLIPELLKMELTGEIETSTASISIASKALHFGLMYYCLRDAIFYSYAGHEPVSFQSDGCSFHVRYRDTTILRQFALEHHIFILNSIEKEETGGLSFTEKFELLVDTVEWDLENPAVKRVLDSFDFEAEWKMEHLFSYLPKDSEHEMAGFSYHQYYTVALKLLKVALYARYYSKANSVPSVISYRADELAAGIHRATDIPVKQCTLILRAISRASESTFIFVSPNKILLFSWAFSLKDLLGRGLRDLAARKPNTFVANFAGPIGDALVMEVVSHFDAFRNFRSLPEIDLQKYSTTLPDIDVLACSYEPSLGFHAFICEAKNNLPGSWAKERLKSVGEDGFITKALEQMSKIREFLGTSDGVDLLQTKIRTLFSHLDFKTLFPTGFCVALTSLVITSQTCGMFLPKQNVAIVSVDLLRHILKSSDGDVTYILECLKQLGPTIDQTYEVTNLESEICEIPVHFDACKIVAMLNFSKNAYLSKDIDKELEKTSLEHGYHFIDTLDLSSKQSKDE